MSILMVTGDTALSLTWATHLARAGWDVHLVDSEDGALAALRNAPFSVMVLDLLLPGGSALGLADYAAVRQPDLKVILYSNSIMFSDGSIFQHCPNACAMVRGSTRPDDLAAMVEHYSRAA